MKKTFRVVVIVLVTLIGGAGIFYWQNLRGIGPVVRPPQGDITQTVNTAGTPLTIPAGFSIEIFAKDLPGARVMVRDSVGNFWVSSPSAGTVTQLELNRETGAVQAAHPVFQNLRKPHGLALHPDNQQQLYIAEEHQISRVSLSSVKSIEKIADLPAGDGHFTRTLGFGPDKRLYVAIGSSCNVCDERDQRRAKIFSMQADGSDLKEYARGLRNAVFFTWHPKTQQLWATDNGRDLLGDNLPPDEVNIVTEGDDYGWPLCYGKNIVDRVFHPDDHDHIVPDCFAATGSHIDIPAHSAPLGLAFIPEDAPHQNEFGTGYSWPEEFQGDLLVAYHGSWNRTKPTGYKVVRYQLDEEGNVAGSDDFITGWLTSDNQAAGRPVDIRAEPGGVVYISDDKAGVIYRLRVIGNQ